MELDTLISSIEARGEVLIELRELANRVPFDERGNSDIQLEDVHFHSS